MDALQHISRKTFLRTSATIASGLLLKPLQVLAASNQTKITILHTNDWHSRIDAFPQDGGKFAGLGGVATRAALIKKIRAQEKNVLLFDAGDIFQGTPYFNFFGGELEYKLMSQMQYDAATLGNHDFDNGIDGIMQQLPHATFGFINCNYNFDETKLKGIVKPYQVFVKNGVKVGVIGVGIDLKGLVSEQLHKGIIYNDPIVSANQFATYLKNEKKCDAIICLSHLGFEYQNDKVDDKKLAQKSLDIDVIIGGHTHTFLPKPVTVKNTQNKEVIINQVGWAGLQLGKIDLFFDSAKTLVNKEIGSNLSISQNLI